MFFADPIRLSSANQVALERAKEREAFLVEQLKRYAEHAWPEIERKLKEMP